MNLKLLYKKPFFLPAFIIFIYFCLILDTVKYPGFVGKHFLIDARMYLSACIVLVLISKTKNHFSKTISVVNLFIFVVSGLGCIYFSVAEAIHYPNYVLSTFHFSLEGLVYVVLLSGAIFFVERLGIEKIINKRKINFGKTVIYFLITYTLIVNIGMNLKNSLVSDFYVAFHLNDSYDQKMHFQWLDFYDYMLFVKNNTPENANIIIPPQIAPWWSRSGNLLLVRSFLYPRNIIQYQTEEIPDISSLLSNTYIMVAWGEWRCDIGVCKGWPEQSIKSKEAIFKDPNSVCIKEIKEDFVYDPKDTSNPFGLLKI